MEQVSLLLELRRRGGYTQRPLIVWEPKPSSCTPDNQDAFFRAVRVVDIFSPNHIELAKIFGNSRAEIFNREALNSHAAELVTSGISPSNEGAVVIRAGEQGCSVKSASQPTKWIAAYFQPRDRATCSEGTTNKTVDPTGAGNAFLGAFAMGFLKTGSSIEAAYYGNIGASFAMEQVGLPQLDIVEGGRELWNGVEVEARLRSYRESLRIAV